MLSLGLGRAWLKQGLAVLPFKKGPDYIDAAWLSAACGRTARNLDPWFLPPSRLLDLFAAAMNREDNGIALLEGNRGLYDGLNESGSCSTAQVARAIACPILLCLDCSKATRTVAAIINGLVGFETGLDFAGVVLNRVGSARHETSLCKAIETNTNLPVLGAIPRLAVNLLPERHMGIASFGGGLNHEIERILDELANLITAHCNTAEILACAKNAQPLPEKRVSTPEIISKKNHKPPVIGFVRDEALWFYYKENLDALKEAGASLRQVSLFKNDRTWEGLAGIYLGGGFPEDMCARLSGSPCLARLAGYVESGIPVYAECGGLLILCAGLEKEGTFWPMANVFQATAQWTARPQGLGYVEARVVRENPFYQPGLILRGHEFHYSRIQLTQHTGGLGLQLLRGSGICKDAEGTAYDGLLRRNAWGSYTHIFAPALPCWAANFVASAASWQRQV